MSDNHVILKSGETFEIKQIPKEINPIQLKNNKILSLAITSWKKMANQWRLSVVLGKYSNKTEIDGKEAYFNSYQLVYDKTSLAIDYDLGGVMVFRYACDDLNHKDMSLFTAINQSINDRIG